MGSTRAPAPAPFAPGHEPVLRPIIGHRDSTAGLPQPGTAQHKHKAPSLHQPHPVGTLLILKAVGEGSHGTPWHGELAAWAAERCGTGQSLQGEK